MREISSSIDISAPPGRVWQILTDFAFYPDWNPFIEEIAGPLKVGERLHVRIRPPGGKSMTFKPTILTVEENRKIHWLGRLLLPGLFDGEHHLEISPMGSGSSFRQAEKFSGILVRVIGGGTFEQTQRGFAQMNEALKQRAES